jgi:hypothetical protein
VTVDGGTQVGEDQLFVFLADPQHLDKQPKTQPCTKDGTFEFTTYSPGDGVPLGKYVVGFVALHATKKGRGAGPASGVVPYHGPDGLKNLYNDPDKNKDIPEFLVDVTQPGRTDYDFNLTVAGKEAGRAGPHALKGLADSTPDF